jgi:cell division protease FtsH
MVTQYGMTERIGAIKLGSDNGEPFLGRDMGHQRDYSEEVASVVDEEVKRFIESAHDEAWEILVDNREVLDTLVLALLDKETLDKAEVAHIFTAIKRRPPRPAWTGSSKRIPQRGPVLTPSELSSPNGKHSDEHSMGVTSPVDVPEEPLPSDEIPGRPLGMDAGEA